jgi:hypothetical protein
MIDFVFYIGNLDIARKSSHKKWLPLFLIMLLLLKDTIPMDVCSCDKDGKIMEEQSIKTHLFKKR